jgi:uncharacterized protein involved in outer membrane biogenesis
MRRVLKWFLLSGLAVLLLLAVGVWAVQRWVGTGDFKARVAQQAGLALGLGVKIERIDVSVWPVPAVALQGLQIQSRPVLKLDRLELRPAWMALLQGRLEIETLLLKDAVLPQDGLENLLLMLQKKKQQTIDQQGTPEQSAQYLQYLPRRTVVHQLTWLGSKGGQLTLDADAQLNAQGLPDEMTLKITKGQLNGSSVKLLRTGNEWALSAELGGGTIKGYIALQAAQQAGAAFALKGQLRTRGVELAALSGEPVLSGRLDADSTLSARATAAGAILDALQTQSKFTVNNAVLHGLDLVKAVQTVGLSRGGQTHLDTLAGQVQTQGRSLQFHNLVASSGVLSAAGHVSVSPSRTLVGRISVDLAASTLGSAVGVPLNVGGTLETPELTLTRGALLGAALGTAVLPGVGTGAGASLGDRLGNGLKKLFGK